VVQYGLVIKISFKRQYKGETILTYARVRWQWYSSHFHCQFTSQYAIII